MIILNIYLQHLKDSSQSYTCPLCKNVMSKYYRKQHQRYHTKLYSCDICGMTFAEKKLILNHITSNHTKSEFKCTKCQKTFKSQYSLQQHNMRAHANRVKCVKCDAEFHARYLLQRHVQVHHEGKRWQCKYPRCTIKFALKTGAQAHLRNVHKLKREDLQKYSKMLELQ